MYTEQILESTGDMSLFQILMMFIMYGPKGLAGWGMLLMSFAGTTPEWWCVPDSQASMEIGTKDHTFHNITARKCFTGENITCTRIYKQDKNTVINEWNLVCDDSGIPAFVTSIQMVGVLLGALFAGQSADTFGRKPTYFLSLALDGAFNLIAAFSVSWQMFTVLRFFIGMTIGSILVVSYPYYMEFVGPKWRPICSAIPFWVTGVCLMALSCWLRPDWSHQHIILAAVHIPFLLGWLIVPESLRFLAVKDRIDEAEKVVDQMCRYNKREKPANTRALLEKIAAEEAKRRENGSKYTYLDIYRNWSICWKSLIIQFVWMCLSFVYYGISFGAGKLSGNLYLNIFLLSVVEIPGSVAAFFLNNRIGRRWTCFLLFSTAVAGSAGVVIASRVASEDTKGAFINALALVAKLGVGAAWGAFQVISSETYPTVTRNLGYGAANTAARVGGIIAPYIFSMEGDDVLIPFIIVGSVMAVCAVLSLVMRETKGIPLPDSNDRHDSHSVESAPGKRTDINQTSL